VLEEALLHHLAVETGDRSLAVVERRSDSTLLRRIGALFGRLTGGAYHRPARLAEEDAGAGLRHERAGRCNPIHPVALVCADTRAAQRPQSPRGGTAGAAAAGDC